MAWNAGAVGQGGLYAARITAMAGGAQNAIGSAVREFRRESLQGGARDRAGQRQSLRMRISRLAWAGLKGFWNSTELSGGLGALGESNQALQGADQSAANNPWMKLLMQGVQSAGQVGSWTWHRLAHFEVDSMASTPIVPQPTGNPVLDNPTLRAALQQQMAQTQPQAQQGPPPACRRRGLPSLRQPS